MVHTPQSIERNIRVNNLRGAFAGGLEAAAAEHRKISSVAPDMLAMERLAAIENEMAAAAERGDTAGLRRLIAEKEQIEFDRDRRTDALLAQLNARTIPAPEDGEEQRVAVRSKELNRQITRKQNEKKRLLAALVKQPDCQTLIARVEKIDEWLRDVQPEIESLAARQATIAAWHEQQSASGELERAKKETKKAAQERERDEARMTALADLAAKAWKDLTESLREFEIITARRMRAAGLRREYEPLASTSESVRAATNGGCTRTEGIHGVWTISGRVRPEVPA